MKLFALRSALGALALSFAFGCASQPLVVPPPPDPPPEPGSTAAPVATTPAAPPPEDPSFRKAPPPPGPEVAFVPPKIEEARLSNGLRVLLVERHEMPIVAVNVIIDRGAEQQASPGQGAAMAAMLLQGTKMRSALALSDELNALGASYSASGDHDGIYLSAQVLSSKAAELMPILADVVLHPAFDGAELKREKARRLTALAAQKDNPGILLGNTLMERLYPAGHPYREPLLGTKASLEGLSSGGLSSLYGALFRPAHATITIAGDIGKQAAIALVERNFGAWEGKGSEAAPPKDPPPLAKGEKRIYVLDRPGAAQSQVAVTLVGVPRKNPDFDALMVMNTLLGGQFSSRLNLNLREKHAYTYGARSGFDMRHGAGPFSAGGAIMTPATAPAIKEIFAEIERLRKDDVPADELADAKANLARQLPARFETAAETAGTLARLAIYGLPLDEPATRPARIAKITAADVKRVAEKYLQPELMRVVIVGDAAVIEKELGDLGMGAVDVKRAPKKPEKKPGAKPAEKKPGDKPAQKKPEKKG